jgi:nucleotide-binding universal stress UspA family protein
VTRRNHIVVGVDGSDHSVAALRWALEEAEALGATVEAVLAWQLPLISVPGAFERDRMEASAKELLVDVVSSVAPAPPVPLLTTVAEGDTIASLVAAAGQADLLVLGTRGRSPFKGLLLGSVSQGCAATAPCPVVIVKLTTPPSQALGSS